MTNLVKKIDGAVVKLSFSLLLLHKIKGLVVILVKLVLNTSSNH